MRIAVFRTRRAFIPLGVIYALTAALLELSGLPSDILSLSVADAQRISDSVKNVKVFGPSPLTSLKEDDLLAFSLADDPSSPLSSTSASPVIRVAGANDRVVLGAYWIDFVSGFDQHDRFSQWVQSQEPGQILIRHEFWGEPLNAISLEFKDTAMLKEIVGLFPEIKLVEPVAVYSKPKTMSIFMDNIHAFMSTREKDLSNVTPHKETGVAQVHESLKLFGKGIKVGIIDSGTDYKNPALGGCFGKGCKVAYGYDFVGDDGKSPDNDPRSTCDGHGTHVSGIIAANSTYFLGVAPQSTLGSYRVFPCVGSAPNDIIIKALLRAAEDGMDVINLSLGGPGGWNQEREALVIDMLSEKLGILVVAAAGNEGDMGAFEMGSPGVSRSAISVSSNENPYSSSWYFVASNSSKVTTGLDQNQPRKIPFLGDKVMDLNTTLAQIAPGISGNVTADACKPTTKDIKGKIVLVRRGDCTFAQKLKNMMKAKATGVIIINNLVGEPATSVSKSGLKIPVRSISREDGEFLLKQMQSQSKNGGIRIADGPSPITVKNTVGGLLSNFTSLGPDSELNLKPDITAPGGNIWSTFPLSMGGFGSDSGTSMASPYIAGCAALFLQGRPKSEHNSVAFKTALQNAARPILDGNPQRFNGPASVLQQGAGLVQMMEVLTSSVSISPSYVSLNDTLHLNGRQTFTITNLGKNPVTYRVDLLSAVGLTPFERNGTVAVLPKKTFATASMKSASSVQTIRVDPGSNATLDLDFSGPKNNPLLHVLYSGFIRFRPEKLDKSTPMISVPFLGMKGDYKTVAVFDRSFGLR
ncbi:hypothetical protein EMPS_10851 [Entomortierella parvispora]|uniref:Subtilisin-like protease n=1 Tax=Entomortierella parvispora TaxID=205924 RepID=A0A9P3HKS6_9FUNG|nr:hypothetical protein EMPS_10851 [Entomortierella parvispora]